VDLLSEANASDSFGEFATEAKASGWFGGLVIREAKASG